MESLFSNGVTWKNFYKFVWPSVLMMLVMSLYYNADTVLIANLLGETELAAMSIAYPVQGIMWGICVMLASGSSAIVAIRMGEGKQEEANQNFTLICVISVIIGLAYMLIMLIWMDPIISMMGATGAIEEPCREFLTIFVFGVPAAFVGTITEYYIRVDGSPGFTVILYLSNGVVHVIAAIILMGPLDMGMTGCGIANVAGMATMVILGIGYFLVKERHLKFRKFKLDAKFMGKCFVNGSSEMVTEASSGITTFFFNIVIIGIAAKTGMASELGVSATSIVMNLQYFFLSIFMGFIMGVAPLISFYYGAREFDKVNEFIRHSVRFTVITSVIGGAICLLGANLLVMIFERPGSELYDLAVSGVRFISISILLCGFNIYGSGFFTAYGNGLISAAISASRGLVAVIMWLYILSPIFGMKGVFLTPACAETVTLILTFAMFRKYKKSYNYKLRL